MRIKLGSILVVVNILGVITVLVTIFFPSNIPRIVFGIPFLFFCPGYTLIAALFSRKAGMSGIARLSLSLTISLAIITFIGIILNYTTLGIRLDTIVYSVFSFVIISSIIAWFRQNRLLKEERFGIDLKMRPSGDTSGWGNMLNFVLMVVVLGTIGVIIYTTITPRIQEAFTEFYILGNGGKAIDYPIEMKAGQESIVFVGIINHEGYDVDYRVDVVLSNEIVTKTDPVTLVNHQKWESQLKFVPQATGEYQKLEFLLYKDNDAQPCLEPLHLWVNVEE